MTIPDTAAAHATPPADRLRADAADNRLRILAAARAAFATEGRGVPVHEIARRARVSPATVHRRFAGKDALYEEAFAEDSSTCSAIVAEGLARTDPWLGLRHVIEQLLLAHAVDEGFRAAATRPLDGSGVHEDRGRAWRGLHELLERARAAGDVHADVRLEDVVLALMANEGLLGQRPELRAAASRRLAALILRSFGSGRDDPPLPPPARLRPPSA